MVLVRPVTRTKISTTDFGHPVYDGLIRTGGSRTGIQASMPSGVQTTLTWSTVVADTGGFVYNTSSFRVPAGKDGLYVATITVIFSAVTAGAYIITYLEGDRYDMTGPGGGRFASTIVRPMAAGGECYFALYNGTGAALPTASSRCDFYRVGL